MSSGYRRSVESAGVGIGASVAIVEDDPTVRSVTADYLAAGGYRVDAYADGLAARTALRQRMPDLLVVDRMLPRLTGDELVRDVRGFSDVPIVMLTALGTVEDRIAGLEHGADDYLGKPFSLRELMLRIEGLLRRRIVTAPDVFVAGPFRVDPAHRRVWAHGREIALTPREYELFLHLVRNPDRVLGRDDILGGVWGWRFGDASTVTVHVRRLREKIERDPRFPCHLLTEWGAGYRFVLEAPSC